LWSALAHQGDVYSASFAAVPYIINALASSPQTADSAYFQFPAWIEICRQKNKISVPENLAASYFESLSRIPSLIAAASAREWDNTFLQCALSALAAAKGQTSIAEAVQELSPEIADKFLEWHFDR
jgi:DNA-binding phage protein